MCFGSDPYTLEFGYFFASIKPAVTNLFASGSMLKEWWVLFFVISGDSSLIYITSHFDYVVFLFRAPHTLLNRWIAVQISRVCCSLFGRKCHRPGCWYLTSPFIYDLFSLLLCLHWLLSCTRFCIFAVLHKYTATVCWQINYSCICCLSFWNQFLLFLTYSKSLLSQDITKYENQNIADGIITNGQSWSTRPIIQIKIKVAQSVRNVDQTQSKRQWKRTSFGC